MSSPGAQRAHRNNAIYDISKGGVDAMTRCLAVDFGHHGIRVNAIAPGPVVTPMLEKVPEAGISAMERATLVGRLAQPIEIARTVAAIADPLLFGYTTGQVFAANGGMYME